MSASHKIFFLTALLMLFSSPIRAADWSTAAHDAARTGRTDENVGGSGSTFIALWTKIFQYENIATVAQVITGGGRAYIGTLGRDGSYGGKIRAFSPSSGADIWTYDDLKGGIAHTLTYDSYLGGTVIGASTLGEIVAIEASSGQERWKYDTGFGGFSVCPTVADNTVLLGSRNGKFYALNLDGTLKWEKNIGAPITNTAAADGGIVYFMDESITAYALYITNGSHVSGWPSEQLYGGTARHYWPVIADDYVLFRVAPAHRYNWEDIENMMGADRGNILAPLCADPNADLITHLDTSDGKHDQTLYVLRRSNGRKVATTTATHVGGSGSVNAPPVIRANGDIIVVYRTKCSMWDNTSWVNYFSAMGTLDPATGYITQIVPNNLVNGTYVPWGDFWIIPDESAYFSIADDVLFCSHQGNFGGLDFRTKRTFRGIGQRDSFGGYPTVTWHRQEWHGAPGAPLTISNGIIYYVTGGRIIAIR
jgi:outer membrane protein assembly factor BamB